MREDCRACPASLHCSRDTYPIGANHYQIITHSEAMRPPLIQEETGKKSVFYICLYENKTNPRSLSTTPKRHPRRKLCTFRNNLWGGAGTIGFQGRKKEKK